ncbi:hypothetical protein VTK73DRAFT_5124 [Phialemonium thermophilum]|uniref:Secreted protein n=1 Tax=Phialemonium thermophilum TaxID=223376 RepID=A0ABR3V3T0_9PEZI
MRVVNRWFVGRGVTGMIIAFHRYFSLLQGQGRAEIATWDILTHYSRCQGKKRLKYEDCASGTPCFLRRKQNKTKRNSPENHKVLLAPSPLVM